MFDFKLEYRVFLSDNYFVWCSIDVYLTRNDSLPANLRNFCVSNERLEVVPREGGPSGPPGLGLSGFISKLSEM